MRGPNHLRTSGLGENDKRRDIHVFIDDGDRRGHWEMMAPWYTSTQMGSNGPSLGTTSDDGAKLPSDPDCELTRICSTISHSLGNLIIPLSEVWLPEWGVHNQGHSKMGRRLLKNLLSARCQKRSSESFLQRNSSMFMRSLRILSTNLYHGLHQSGRFWIEKTCPVGGNFDFPESLH